MSVDYTRTGGEPTPESESPMFAPTPLWDRKAKGRGARRNIFQDTPEEPVTTSAAVTGAAGGVAADRIVTDDELARETAMSPTGDDAFVAPANRRVVRRDRSMAPAAVVVGLVAIAALAAAGWYATRPGDTVLTPGGPNAAPATSVASTSTTTTSSGGANLAANTPPAEAAAPAATHTATTRSTTTTTRMASAAPVIRHRSAAVVATPEAPVVSRSATGAGVNTGAIAPATPVPPAATVTQTPAGAAPSIPQTAAPPPAAGPIPAAPPVTATPSTPSPTPSTTTPDVTPPASTTAPSPTPGSGTPPQ